MIAIPISARASSVRRAAVLGGAAVVLVAAAGSMLGLSSANAGDAVLPITPVKASELVQATSGQGSSDLQATGDQAKLINAALPFSNGPVVTARPFVLSGDRLDESRAEECLTQAV